MGISGIVRNPSKKNQRISGNSTELSPSSRGCGIRKSTDMRISRTSGSRSLGRNIRRCQMPAPCERNSKRARRESRKLSRSRLSAKFTAFTRQLHSVCIRAALIYKACPVHFILDERTLPPRIERPDFHKLLFGGQSPDLLHLRFVLCLN